MIETYSTRFYDNSQLQATLDQIHTLSYHRTETELRFSGEVFSAATEIVEEAIDLPENKKDGRYGGCMVYGRRGVSWTPASLFIGGAIAEDPEFGHKWDKYTLYAFGKAAVLISNQDFLTSGENKSLSQDRRLRIINNPVPGGGIATPDGSILAFSGFSEEADEAVCLATAWKVGLINEQQARIIANKGTGKSFDIAKTFIIH